MMSHSLTFLLAFVLGCLFMCGLISLYVLVKLFRHLLYYFELQMEE